MQTSNTDALKSAVHNVPFRLLVLSCAAAAIGSLAMNYTDSRATVGYTQVCFKPSNIHVLKQAKKKGIQYCTEYKRHWISDPILSDWERTEPEFYDKLTRLKTLPAQTQSKWIYGAVAVVGGLSVAGLGAARLNLINKLAPGYRKEVQAQWHRDAVRNGVQMASDVIDGKKAVLNKQYRSEIDLARDQSAYLTPEEINAQIQEAELMQAQQQAYLQGQQEAGNVQPSQAQLPGQSMEQVANPGDKVKESKQSQNLELGNNPAEDILNCIARADNSTVLVGDPGTGKSTVTNDYINRVRAIYPNADFRVLAVKNDSFSGLNADGKVTRLIGEDAIETANNFFTSLRAEYDRRLGLPESERDKLTPLVVILDDWLSIAGKLTKALKDKLLTIDYGQVLFDILIIGREYNMKFFANLHSLNLAAIGIEQLDQNTRACLNMLLLGNRYQKDGREVDAYKVIEQALSGNQVVPNQKDKDKLREIYSKVKSQSRTEYRPVMFAYIGQYFLGLVPRINKNQSTPVDSTKAFDEKLKAVRDLISDCWTKDDSELSDNAQKLNAWIQRKFKEGKTVFTIEMCRASGCVPGAKSSDIKQLLDELIQANIMVLKDGGVYELR